MYMDQARVAALVGGNPRFADPKSEPPGYYIWQGTDGEISSQTIALYWEKLAYAAAHGDELVRQAFDPVFFDFYGVDRSRCSSPEVFRERLHFDSFVLVPEEKWVGGSLSDADVLPGHFIECWWDYEWNLLTSEIN